jgi:hypothetical protein
MTVSFVVDAKKQPNSVTGGKHTSKVILENGRKVVRPSIFANGSKSHGQLVLLVLGMDH